MGFRRGPGRDRAARGKPDASAVLARFDKNGDGKLVHSEVPDKLWSRIRKADQDDDGDVTTSELQAAMKKHRKHRASEARRRERKDNDVRRAPPRRRPGHGDRERSRERAGRGDMPRDADRVFKRFDDNQDDRLSEDELPGFLWRRLADADQDRDQHISKQEFQQARVRMPRRGPRRDQGHRPRDRDSGKDQAEKASQQDLQRQQPDGDQTSENNSGDTGSPGTEPAG